MFNNSLKITTAFLLALILVAQTQGLTHAHVEDVSIVDCHLCLQVSADDETITPAGTIEHMWVSADSATRLIVTRALPPIFAFNARGPPSA